MHAESIILCTIQPFEDSKKFLQDKYGTTETLEVVGSSSNLAHDTVKLCEFLAIRSVATYNFPSDRSHEGCSIFVSSIPHHPQPFQTVAEYLAPSMAKDLGCHLWAIVQFHCSESPIHCSQTWDACIFVNVSGKKFCQFVNSHWFVGYEIISLVQTQCLNKTLEEVAALLMKHTKERSKFILA